MSELHGYGVSHLVMESRTRQLNRRDVATVAGARFLLPKDTQFRVDHRPGADEPLFWVADVVAGAVGAYRQGESTYRQYLGECLYEIEVATQCAPP